MTEHRLQPRLRTISSTFSDLKLERDALQQRVFPGTDSSGQKSVTVSTDHMGGIGKSVLAE